jgi:hypothetical protein
MGSPLYLNLQGNRIGGGGGGGGVDMKNK